MKPARRLPKTCSRKHKGFVLNRTKPFLFMSKRHFLSDKGIGSRDVAICAELKAGKASRRSEQIPSARRWSEDHQISFAVAVEISRSNQISVCAELD